MDIRPIRTEEDHEQALREIERLWNSEPGTLEGDKLDVLATLVEAYEGIRWPIEPLDPIETIEAHMEMSGLTQVSLAGLLGSRSRASEILGRKRALTMDMVFKINKEWRIPAEILVRPYHLIGTPPKQYAVKKFRHVLAGKHHAVPPRKRRIRTERSKSA